MLKNVVLPAPLGPMIETIARSGIEKVTSLTAVRPPKRLVTLVASSSSAVRRRRGGGLGRRGLGGGVAHARAAVDGLSVVDVGLA